VVTPLLDVVSSYLWLSIYRSSSPVSLKAVRVYLMPTSEEQHPFGYYFKKVG
jgi:hypothetical protein